MGPRAAPTLHLMPDANGLRPKSDLRAQLFRMCGVDLTRIDGVGVTTALAVVSEVGTDMSRFPTIKHVHRAAQALRLAAAALRSSKSALGAYFRRMCSLMDKPTSVIPNQSLGRSFLRGGSGQPPTCA